MIASLNGDSLSGWVELGRELEAAGADALELNAWHLPGSPDETGSAVEERYIALLGELKSGGRHPDLPEAVALLLGPAQFRAAGPRPAGAAGVSLFNRFFQPDIDLDTLDVVDRVQLSTSADTLLAMRWIAILRGQTPTHAGRLAAASTRPTTH